jgi:hypothetical protein
LSKSDPANPKSVDWIAIERRFGSEFLQIPLVDYPIYSGKNLNIFTMKSMKVMKFFSRASL